MIILIMGRSNSEIDWNSLFLFNKVDNFLLIVKFNSNLPLGLHILSFHNLLNAWFCIKYTSGAEILWPWFFADDELCLSLIYPNEAILLACFYSRTVLSY